MNKEMEHIYWLKDHDWFDYDSTKDFLDDGAITMKPDAPERAKKSFDKWLTMKDEIREREASRMTLKHDVWEEIGQIWPL